jgi:hypothetical protein
VVEIIDGLCAVVKKDVQRELLHVSHTTTLLLKLMFAQAETIMFDLHADTSKLENERLLKEIASFEEASIQRERDPKKGLTPLSKPSDAALKHNISVLSEQNKNFKEQFLRMQQQCIEVLRDKTRLGEDLERAKAQLAKLGIELEKASEKPEVNSTYKPTSYSVEQKKKDLEELEKLQQQLAHLQVEKEAAKSEGDTLKHQLDAVNKELEKKLQQCAPFVNLKKMLVKKNNQIKQLREIVMKYEPESAILAADSKEES